MKSQFRFEQRILYPFIETIKCGIDFHIYIYRHYSYVQSVLIEKSIYLRRSYSIVYKFQFQ